MVDTSTAGYVVLPPAADYAALLACREAAEVYAAHVGGRVGLRSA